MKAVFDVGLRRAMFRIYVLGSAILCPCVCRRDRAKSCRNREKGASNMTKANSRGMTEKISCPCLIRRFWFRFALASMDVRERMGQVSIWI